MRPLLNNFTIVTIDNVMMNNMIVFLSTTEVEGRPDLAGKSFIIINFKFGTSRHLCFTDSYCFPN